MGSGPYATGAITPTLVNWEITFGAICCISYVVNWLEAFIMCWLVLGVLGGDGVCDLILLVGGVVVLSSARAHENLGAVGLARVCVV